MSSGAGPTLLDAIDVERIYRIGHDVEVPALRGVSFTVAHGDHVAIVGSSGSGKSTLLNLLGALDRPTSGEVRYDGRDVRTLSDAELAELRNRRIGFVFQSFQLLPRLSAIDNVALPLVYRPGSARHRRERAIAALHAVGLGDRLEHRPTELSGGQQQRVAIARAVVTEPALVLADEPTGNLDTTTGDEIMTLLEELHGERGTALVVITHEAEIARRARRRIELRDGLIVAEVGLQGPEAASEGGLSGGGGPEVGLQGPEAASEDEP